MNSVDVLEREILARITPTAQQQTECERLAVALTAAADAELGRLGVPAKATVQGSVAKGTWLAESGDIDLFILVDPAVPVERLERIVLDVGKRILRDAHTRYAQHPYLIGTYEGRMVDLVPAYAVSAASAKMSAVDRTPFHTEWVRSHLDGAGRDATRLLKRFLKGTGCYGAQTATGGFSGYLAEVLVAHFGSFAGVLAWLAGDASTRRIALGPDLVKDDVAVLIVVDPVDPARNCAAAVQPETIRLAGEAARAYAKKPDARFFFPNPPRSESAATLQGALQTAGNAWVGLLLRPRTDRLDIVFPQFQKATRGLAAGLEDAGFPVRRMTAMLSPGEDEVMLQWVADGRELPATRVHRGPVDDGRPNGDRFRDKWQGHGDAAGPVRRGASGHLEVELQVTERSASAWFTANVRRMQAGRHVQEALGDSQLLGDPATVPAPWAPAVAEFVLDRRPWQR